MDELPAGRAHRPFRFGVLTTSGTDRSLRGWANHARKVEALGFDTLQVADHFENNTVCTPRLAAAAAVTTSLRVGSYVYDNDFRHPVLLARESAEIDVLSDGRMELGIGAGWHKPEYDKIGVLFDRGPIRAARLEESVSIVRALHSGEPVTHHGTHYRLENCQLLVQPRQHPIPLLLGGGGPQVTRFAGRNADIVAFVPRSLADGGLDPDEFSSAAFAEKVALLDTAAAARTDGGPERAILAFEVHRSLSEVPANDWAPRDVVASGPYCLIGDTAQVVETLLERRERWGLSYWTCWEENLATFIPVVAALSGR